ncbi:MAG: hypothetical protein DRN04_02110 [Thermoprotei archaeon]|nr:MAG: hypothetical protein DRN04_02110 [Thermoprotei archaeon]
MLVAVLGVLGLVFIVAGWIISVGKEVPLRLSLLYFTGSVLLTVYAVLEADLIFIALNSLASIFSGIQILKALKK